MRWVRIFGWTLVAVVVFLGVAVAWLALRSPRMLPPSTETVAATPERLARGEYLVVHVSDCLACHSAVHED